MHARHPYNQWPPAKLLYQPQTARLHYAQQHCIYPSDNNGDTGTRNRQTTGPPNTNKGVASPGRPNPAPGGPPPHRRGVRKPNTSVSSRTTNHPSRGGGHNHKDKAIHPASEERESSNTLRAQKHQSERHTPRPGASTPQPDRETHTHRPTQPEAQQTHHKEPAEGEDKHTTNHTTAPPQKHGFLQQPQAHGRARLPPRRQPSATHPGNQPPPLPAEQEQQTSKDATDQQPAKGRSEPNTIDRADRNRHPQNGQRPPSRNRRVRRENGT